MKNKAEQTPENPLIKELASKECVAIQRNVMAGVNIISLLVLLDVSLFFTLLCNFLTPNR